MKIQSLVQFADRLFDENVDAYRTMRHRTYFRNILYVMGEQYIVFDKTSMELRRSVLPDGVPTPVSNVCRDYVRAEKSLLLADYVIRSWPASNSVKDRNSSEMVERLLRHMDLSNDGEFFDEREKFADVSITCGTGFMRTYPSMDKGQFPYANGKMAKSGEVACEAVTPFSVFVDPLGSKLSNMRYIGVRSIKSREWVEDTFKEIVTTENVQQTMPYEYIIANMIGNVSRWKGWGLTVSDFALVGLDDTVMYKELEFAPSVDYPEGRYVVIVGNKVLKDMDRLPIKVEKSDGVIKWAYSLTDYHHQPVIGRYWGDSGLNDQISPQNTINDIDRQLAMNRISMGRTNIMKPIGANLESLIYSGQSYNVWKYDPKLALNHKPEILHGMPLPNQVLEERRLQQEVIQTASGDPKYVLRGQVPTSDASGLLFESVKETAKESHVQDIQRFRRSIEKIYRNRIVCAKELYTDSRKIKMNEGDKIQVLSLNSSDIRDNTDIRLEPLSRIASTKAGTAIIVSNMANAGMFGDLTQDPETRNMLLEMSGAPKVKDKLNVDVIRAIHENDLIATVKTKVEGEGFVEGVGDVTILIGEAAETVQWGYMPQDETGQPVGEELAVINVDSKFRFDNHQVHYDVHRRFVLSKEFDQLDELQQELCLRHTMAHENAMYIQQKMMMEAQQMMQQPGQEEAPPEGVEDMEPEEFPEPENVV